MSTIVVGVDGSDNSREALGWALEEARAHGGRLEVVHAITDLQQVLPYTVAELGAGNVRKAREGAEQMIDELLEAAGGAGDVEVDRVVEEGVPANVLVARSKDALLLVVGTRGHGRLSEVLLGSVSHQCVHHAECPVVIVRGS